MTLYLRGVEKAMAPSEHWHPSSSLAILGDNGGGLGIGTFSVAALSASKLVKFFKLLDTLRH